MKILVAYDGSVCGDGALYDLARAGLPARLEALVISITVPVSLLPGPLLPGPALESGAKGRRHRKGGAPSGWSEVAVDRAQANAFVAVEEAMASAERARRYLLTRFPGWHVHAEAFAADPARGILNRARSWNPDLIVMGAHGRTALGRLLLGSVAEKVLLHASHDVRIARARIGRGSQAPRILVAFDGSPAALAAVDAVAARVWPTGAAVRIIASVTAADAVTQALEEFEAAAGPKASLSSWIEVRLEAAAARLARPGLKVTPEVLLGDPREILINVARTWAADAIFVGSLGRNSGERFLLGGVSSAIAAHAPCSVEVIRRPGPGRGPEPGASRSHAKIRAVKASPAVSGSKGKPVRLNGAVRSKRPRASSRL